MCCGRHQNLMSKQQLLWLRQPKGLDEPFRVAPKGTHKLSSRVTSPSSSYCFKACFPKTEGEEGTLSVSSGRWTPSWMLPTGYPSKFRPASLSVSVCLLGSRLALGFSRKKVY